MRRNYGLINDFCAFSSIFFAAENVTRMVVEQPAANRAHQQPASASSPKAAKGQLH